MEFNISFSDRTGRQFNLNTLEEFKKFFEAEGKFWEEQKHRLGVNLPANIDRVKRQYDNYINNLESHLAGIPAGNTNINALLRAQPFNQIHPAFINWLKTHWLYRGSDFTEAFLSACEYSLASGAAFLDALSNKKINLSVNGAELNHLIGYLMAYEYLLQDESHLVKRRNAEKKSFSTLRNELEEELNKLLGEVSNFKKDINTWKEATQEKFGIWFEEKQNETDIWMGGLKTRSDKAIDDHSQFFNQMAEHAVNKLKELEDLYREKLRIEAPALYWAKRAENLGKQGNKWARLLILVSTLFSVAAGAFFWVWLTNKSAIPFGLQSLQGVVLFGTTIAGAVFLVRALAKLTFSSFHLQRDAEEREQLAHLYLALMKEGAVDSQSRDIVLQALFSRADSGLLGGESGPTMPTPGEFINAGSRVVKP